MKSISKKLVLTLFSAVFAVCCLFFAATSVNNKVQVNAVTAAFLKANFTNDGEFDIKSSAWGSSLTYIDGTTVGGTGTVLQVGCAAGVNAFRLDLTPMKVTKADVTSIVVKLKAANFVKGTDEFRTTSNTGATWRQYGKTDDLSDWFSYTLNANSMADFTVNSDGTMGYNDIGIRASSSSSLIMYVDSVTVNVRDTSGMEMQTFASVFNNASYNSLTRALLTYTGTATWNDTDDGNLKYKVTLKNSSTGDSVLYANCGSTLSHWGGQKWANFALPGTYDTIIIAEGAHFAGVKIPSGTLNWNTSTTKWDWDGDIELVYGTPTLTARTSGASDNGYGWNHQTGNAAVIKNSDYGYTIGVFGSKITAHSTNLAATKNVTSVSITFNGVSFYKLYQQDDGYRINAQLQYFGFSVPTAALVGSNGYDVPTVEIHKGTPFYENYLPAAKIIYTDGSWKFTAPENYDLDFVSLNESFNNDGNGFFIAQFDTYGWAQGATPTSYRGIKYNGQHIDDLLSYNIRFFGTSSVWFTYTVQASNPKLAAGYNDYSHPTIEIEEGATIVYNGKTFTFHAVTFYLNLSTNKWQTTMPDGYHVGGEVEEATYSGVWGSANTYNSSTTLLLQYTSTSDWDSTDKGDLYTKITYRNSSTSASYSATTNDVNIFGNGYKWIVLSELTGYDVIEIDEGGTFGGVEIPAGTFYLVNGRWVDTAAQSATATFSAMPADWNNRSSNNTSCNILSYSVNPLGAATDSTNQAATLSRTSLMIKYNGSTFFDLYMDANNANRTKYKISYEHGNGHLYVAIPEADLVEGATLVVEEGTPFMNYYLGAITLYYFDGYWVKEAPGAANATFTAIASGWNNLSAKGNSCNILTYSVNPLGSGTDATNLATTINRTSLMVKYNGRTFYDLYSDTTNANHSGYLISYAHGSGYFYFQIPEADLVEGATLVVEDGTPFMNYYLGSVTLYYFRGYWVTDAAHSANALILGFASDSWNNYSLNSTSCNLLNYNVTLGAAASSANLAATPNRTSLMVKYNGSTFYALYSDTTNANRTNYRIDYEHGNSYFYFTIPEADLVDGATLVIEDGTPFMNYYLEGVTLTYNATLGKWRFPVNHEPSFVSVNSTYNNDSNGFFIAQFNTTGWVQQGVPTSYSGITYNGNSITDLTSNIKFYQAHSVWFTYTVQANNPKLAANYNGYSHPTIAFAEGATMVYGGETYTFHAVTFYLNLSTNKWQTEVPDGYAVRNVISYSSVNASYNNNKTLASGYSSTLIQFSGTIGSYTGTNLASTIGAYITVGGSAVSGISGAVVQIGYNSSYTNSLFVKVPVSALVIDGTSKVVEFAITPFVLGDVVVNATALHLVDGVWVSSYSATIRTYVQERWGCWDYTDGYALNSHLPTDDVFALLDYGVYISDGAETTVYTNYITALNDVGNKIKINGTTPLKDEPLARVYLVNAHIVIAVPSCEYVTIDEGTYFLGNLLGAATMYYNGYFWESSSPSPTSVTLTELTWNNFDYNGYGMARGYENNTGVPSNGMVALLKFNTNLTSSGERVSSANQVTPYSKIGNGIKVNNVSVKDIEGAFIGYVLGQAYLFVYIPFAGLTASDVYTLTISAGTQILNASLPAITYYFYDRVWNDVAPETLTVTYEPASFVTHIRIKDSITVNADYLTDVLANTLDNTIVLGWTIGSTNYFYGSYSNIVATASVTITDVVNFYTLRGAGIRLVDDGHSGLRFESRIGNDDLAALVDTYDSVELGTYIAPKALLESYLTANSDKTFKDYFAQAQGSGSSTKYLKIANTEPGGHIGIYNRETYLSDGYVQYFGSISNVYEINYYNNFIGIGYIKLVKGGNTYVVFGSTSLSYTTRNIYDIAKSAYNDTSEEYTSSQLNVIKGYLDAVVDLTYKQGNLSVNEVITEREYSAPYGTSKGNNGYYYIARYGSTVTPKTIIINGKKVSSSDFDEKFGQTINAGSLAMYIAIDDMALLFSDGIVYGIGEPDHILWDNGNEVAEADMLSDIVGALGASAFRIWMGGDIASVSNSNEVSLNSTKLTELFDLIDGLANKGVKEVYFTGIHLPLSDYARIYVNSTIGWVSQNEYYASYSSEGHLYNDYSCVPDPSTEAEAYSKWLKVQYSYYDLITAQLASWQEANLSWSNVKFYFEGINEPEGQVNIHKRGSYSANYINNYFTTSELARVLTDVAYYMTKAANDNLNGTGFVATPALMYISSNSGLTLSSGVYSDVFLSYMAAAIKDNTAPTTLYQGDVVENTKDPEDYFTVLNWHPYVAWSTTDHQELYYAQIKNNRAYVNENYTTNWVAWNNGMYNIFVSNFTGYAPKVVFTELGMMDYGTHVNSFSDYKKIGVNQNLAASVFGGLLRSDVLDGLAFSNNCTIIGFRLCDVESIMAEQGETGLYLYGEGNAGFIEENGTIKQIMKEYYYVINGNNDTTSLQSIVTSYYS